MARLRRKAKPRNKNREPVCFEVPCASHCPECGEVMIWTAMEYHPGMVGLFAIHSEHKTCEQSGRIFDLDDELPLFNCTLHLVTEQDMQGAVH